MSSKALKEIAENPVLLEVARKAIEDALLDFRDDRIFTLRNNGLVIKESNGEESSVIRFGSEVAMAIGLKAIAKFIEENNE